MRKAMLLLAVLGLVGSLWAVDTMGTWKLNIAKSKLPPTAANLKESIIVFREIGGDTIEGISTQTGKDGSTVTAKWTTPKSGGIQTYQQGAPEKGISTVAVVIDGETIYNVTLMNGKQVQLTPIKFSKDGKTYTMTYKGTDAQGKPYEYFVLFEKQ